MRRAAKQPKKTADGFVIVYDLAHIPEFANEVDEASFWDTHTVADGLIDEASAAQLAKLVPPAPARSNAKRPISLRLDEDTLTRLKRLATKKHTNTKLNGSCHTPRASEVTRSRELAKVMVDFCKSLWYNYQTLLKNFVNERLYEEEKREGLVT